MDEDWQRHIDRPNKAVSLMSKYLLAAVGDFDRDERLKFHLLAGGQLLPVLIYSTIL